MQAVVLAVYLPEQWPRLLATAEDADQLETTWEEWHTLMQQTKAKLALQGLHCVEVTVDLDAFEKYCEERGLKNNSGTRASYAADLLMGQNKRLLHQSKKVPQRRGHKKRRRR